MEPRNFFFSCLREKLWRDNNYDTLNIHLDELSDESDEEEEERDRFLDISDDEDEARRRQINYVVGDVTQPTSAGEEDIIVVHCVGK